MRQNFSACLSVLHDQARDGAYNMAFDEGLLRGQIDRRARNAILRFYRFSEPTMTIGYGMWAGVKADDLNFSRAIPIVRRITGGGIVCHTLSDLTYSLIAPFEGLKKLRRVRESYFLIHDALRRALGELGIETQLFERDSDNGPLSVIARQRVQAEPKQSKNSGIASTSLGMPSRNDLGISYCFDSPVRFDVMFGDRKVAGGGQKRTGGYLFHQGSIAWGILTESFPDLVESDFCREFSTRLSEILSLEKSSLPLELMNGHA